MLPLPPRDFPSPDTTHPVILPDGTHHKDRVFLKAAIDSPNIEVGITPMRARRIPRRPIGRFILRHTCSRKAPNASPSASSARSRMGRPLSLLLQIIAMTGLSAFRLQYSPTQPLHRVQNHPPFRPPSLTSPLSQSLQACFPAVVLASNSRRQIRSSGRLLGPSAALATQSRVTGAMPESW